MQNLQKQTDLKTDPVLEMFKYVYVMYYRHGMNPNCTKFFYHKDSAATTPDENWKSARNRADLHCHRMANYRLIFVRPFLSDILFEEQQANYRGTPNPIAVVMGESEGYKIE